MSSSVAALFAAAAILLLVPGVAAATTYGISEPQGLFASCPTHDDPCSSPSGVGGLWRESSFATLRSRGRSVQSVRLPVTYDAVATSDGAAGCALSNPYRFAYTDRAGRAHPAHEAWNDLLHGLKAAYADGLQPLIVIDGYSTSTAIRAYRGSAAPGDPGEPDPTTTAGRSAYDCGVRGILDGIAAHLPKSEWPHRWEAWNEPNGGCTYLNNHCAPTVCAQINEPASNFDSSSDSYTCSATGRDDGSCAAGSDAGGAAKAACLWIEARNTIIQQPGHAADEVAAGSFSWFQFKGVAGAWDSGLLDPRGSPRAAFCLWTGQAPAACPGSPAASPGKP